MKALAKKGFGEQASSKEIIPSSKTVAKPPPAKRAKTTRAKKSTEATSGLSDIPEEGAHPDTVEVADIDTFVVKDVITRPDKGKSLEDEVEDYVLSIPKNQLIEQNAVGNFEFFSKQLREVDGSYYNELGWEKVFEELRKDAIKVRICLLGWYFLYF